MQALAALARPASVSQVLVHGPRLRSGFAALDAALDGFEAGRFTFVDASADLLWPWVLGALCGATVQGPVVAVDGGNTLDPYLVARYARHTGHAPRLVLGKLRVARAFTAYQMSAILEETMPAELLDHHPAMLLVSCLPELYLDEDVPHAEALALVRRAAALLRGAARERGCAVVATNVGVGALAARPAMRRALDAADRVVRLLPAGEGAWAVEGARRVRLQPPARAQATLERFDAPGGVPALGPVQPMLKGVP